MMENTVPDGIGCDLIGRRGPAMANIGGLNSRAFSLYIHIFLPILGKNPIEHCLQPHSPGLLRSFGPEK
jgi:hypothetical protein